MADSPNALKALRDAVQLSPDNVPLRRHYADELMGHGRPEEAEAEYRQALTRAPADATLKTGLALAFHQQGKYGEAAVLVEDVLKAQDPPPRAYLLHARLLLRTDDRAGAARSYQQAIAADPSAADEGLAERLGLSGGAASGAGDDGRLLRKTVDVDETAPADARVEKPAVTFADIGGMDGVKEDVRRKILYPLSHPEMYKAFGQKMGGGILMYGAPGCGKTHLARAAAGEARIAFLAVGVSDVLDMYVGNSERNLHALFEQARENKPCILFFDEVDALGSSRSQTYASGRQLVNQFLEELDGIKASNEGVLVLAATNAPWQLDTARSAGPAGFDRILFVPPDVEARAVILRLLLRDKPMETIDYDLLAKKTIRFSGADLQAIVTLAVEKKLVESMKAGRPIPLTTKDLTDALARSRSSTKEWLATARNYALYGNQGYQEVLDWLKNNP